MNPFAIRNPHVSEADTNGTPIEDLERTDCDMGSVSDAVSSLRSV